MAGIVTYTGALLIKQARELVEQVRAGSRYRRRRAWFRVDEGLLFNGVCYCCRLSHVAGTQLF